MFGGEVAQAYIRIRPNTTGFQSELEGSVKKSMLGVGKIIGGAFAAAGAVELVKHLAETAAGHEAAMAGVRKSVQSTNAQWVVHGKTVTTILDEQARKLGFNDEEIAQAFRRLVTGSQNTETALKGLTLTEDLARFGHIGLSQAAVMVARAQQGVFTSFRRVGIIIKPVTQQQDALTAAHDRAIAAGAKFTKQQKLEYDQLLANAKAADRSVSVHSALAQIQQRVSGQASTFAGTAAGSFARFSVGLHQLEVSIGSALLPELTKAADAADAWFERLQKSGQLQHEVAVRTHEVGSAIHGTIDAIKFVDRITGSFNHTLKDLAGIYLLVKARGMLASAANRAEALAAAKATAANTELAASETAVADAAVAETGALTKAGVAANVAADDALLLGKALRALTLIGTIAIGIELIIQNKGAIDSWVSNHLPGFLGGGHNNVTRDQLRDPNEQAKLAKTFGEKGLQKLMNAAGLPSDTQAAESQASKAADLGAKVAHGIARTAEDSLTKITKKHKDKVREVADASNAAVGSVADNSAERMAGLIQNLKDTIKLANAAVTASVVSAKQNLTTIADAVTADIIAMRNANNPGGALTGASSAAAAGLRQQIASGQATPELRRRAALLAATIQGEQGGQGQLTQIQQDAIRRRADDLAAELRAHLISRKTFLAQIRALYKREGFDFEAVKKREGIAAALQARADIQGLVQQSGNLSAGKFGRNNAGFGPNIIKPLDELKNAQRQIADAQKRIADEQLTQLQKAGREAAKQTKHQQKIATATAATAKAAGVLAYGRANAATVSTNNGTSK